MADVVEAQSTSSEEEIKLVEKDSLPSVKSDPKLDEINAFINNPTETTIKFNGKILILSDEQKQEHKNPIVQAAINSGAMKMDFSSHDMKKVAAVFIHHLKNNTKLIFEVEPGKIIKINDKDNSSHMVIHDMIYFRIEDKSSSSCFDCFFRCNYYKNDSYSERGVGLKEHKESLIAEFTKFL